MDITPEILLKAYACGFFPMAESHESSSVFWVDPEERGILPLDDFHLPKRLARTIRQQPYRVSVDTAFAQVMQGCAARKSGREETWINDQIFDLYERLHKMGQAHSVECWNADGDLVGGLYGVRLAGAFFGESMFHRATDASKIALVYLVGRLRAGGFKLLDTQFITDHLTQFGTIEIPRDDYQGALAQALQAPADFYRLCVDAPPSDVLQFVTQTS